MYVFLDALFLCTALLFSKKRKNKRLMRYFIINVKNIHFKGVISLIYKSEKIYIYFSSSETA